MKKNIKLFLILVGLLTITYFIEERGSLKKIEQQKKQQSLFNEEKLGTLHSISFPSFSLKIVKGKYFVDGEHPIDEVKGSMILEQLSRLQLKTVIPDEEVEKVGRSFFINEKNSWVKFQFERGLVEVYLGKKIDFSKDFYMEIFDSTKSKTEMAIVEDSKPEEAVINAAGNEKSDYKYRRLQSLLWLPKDFVLDQNLFSKEKFLGEEIDRIEIANKKKVPFTLFPKSKTMRPEVPSALSFDEKKVSSFIEQLKKMKGEKVLLNVKDSDFENHLCKIVLFSTNNKKEIDFYRGHKGTLGSFAKIKNADYAISLNGQEEEVFHINYQDFIQKRLLNNLQEGAFIKIEDRSGSLNAQLKKINPRVFKADDKEISQMAFSKLVDYLTKNADYYTPVVKNDPLREGLHVQYGQENYLFLKDAHELIVLNKEKKLKLHYKVTDEAMPSLQVKEYLR